MGGNRGKLLFRLALAFALISICLSAYLISHAQSGPSWEVPVAVVTELATLPWLSLLLALIAAILYGRSRRGDTISAASQRAFLITFAIAFMLPVVIWLFQPAQWAYHFVLLSLVARLIFGPVVIVSIVLFWLIGFSWVKQTIA